MPFGVELVSRKGTDRGALNLIHIWTPLIPSTMTLRNAMEKSLYRWGLREKRAEVLKFVSCPPDPHKGIGRYEFLSVLITL